jgi:predicted small secreted protein
MMPRPPLLVVAVVALVALALAGCPSGGGAGSDPTATVPTTQQAAVGGSGYGQPTVLGNLADPDVTESSGIVASRRNPGLYWTHNDSGDDPFIYCVKGRGEPCGTWLVSGASARDWEDIAAGPGPVGGTSYLYVGDIGDNLEDQDVVLVHRVPEPSVAAGQPGPTKAAPGTTEPAETLRLQYPDGSHNAEALLVHPRTGDLYIVVKEAGPGVYVARAPLQPGGRTTMAKVGTLPLGQAGEYSMVTGGDISPDGQRVALCNYEEGFELRLPAGASNFDDIWQQTPQPLRLGLRPQGEAIAYRLDGKALVTTSERPQGLPGPMHQVEQR